MPGRQRGLQPVKQLIGNPAKTSNVVDNTSPPAGVLARGQEGGARAMSRDQPQEEAVAGRKRGDPPAGHRGDRDLRDGVRDLLRVQRRAPVHPQLHAVRDHQQQRQRALRLAGADRRDRRRFGRRASRPDPGRRRRSRSRCNSNGLPIHSDATVRIRDRLFLEGGYYLELDPGQPERADRARTGSRSRSRTRRPPVQFYKVLSTFDSATRQSLDNILNNFNAGLQPQPRAARVRQRRRRPEAARSRS